MQGGSGGLSKLCSMAACMLLLLPAAADQLNRWDERKGSPPFIVVDCDGRRRQKREAIGVGGGGGGGASWLMIVLL